MKRRQFLNSFLLSLLGAILPNQLRPSLKASQPETIESSEPSKYDDAVCVTMTPPDLEGSPEISIVGWGDYGARLLDFLVHPKELSYVYESDEFRNKSISRQVFPEIGENSDQWLKFCKKGTDLLFVVAEIDALTSLPGLHTMSRQIAKNAMLSIGILNYRITNDSDFGNLNNVSKELKETFDTVLLSHHLRDEPIHNIQNDRSFAFIRGLIDLAATRGMICLDFADIMTVMKNGRFLNIGQGYGKNNLIKAAEEAITANWNSDLALDHAKSVIVLIRADETLSLLEAHKAAEYVQEKSSPDADVIFALFSDRFQESDAEVIIIANYMENTLQNLIQSFNGGVITQLKNRERVLNNLISNVDRFTVKDKLRVIDHISESNKRVLDYFS